MAATGELKARASAALARRREQWPWLDLLVRGVGRYQRTEGSVAATHIAYSAFFSLFPLLFAAVGVFGLVLRGDTELCDRLLDAAAQNLPEQLRSLVGTSITSAESSASTSLGVGLVLLLYSGTGMVVALERGLSRAFGLERAGTLVKQRLRALGWLLSIGLLLGVSVAAAAAIGGAGGAILEALGVTGARPGCRGWWPAWWSASPWTWSCSP